jgi:hypothetical protein
MKTRVLMVCIDDDDIDGGIVDGRMEGRKGETDTPRDNNECEFEVRRVW